MLCAVLHLGDGPQLVLAGSLLPDLEHSAVRSTHAHGVDALAGSPHGAQANGAGRGGLHLPHLGSAAHVLPQVEPGAVCGAGHHQVDELAGGAVADTVNAVALPDESPLLLGLVLVLAQTDVAAVLDALHSLNDAAGLGGDGVEAVCFNDSLCHRFHKISLRIPGQDLPGTLLCAVFCLRAFVSFHKLYHLT